MATLPASYPNIPYLGLIPGGLYHGLMIRINGEMSHHERFNIDIKTGPILQPSDDINLHLSVRPNENVIVRNHMTHQVWGGEERFGGCPINFGQPFEILILAESDQFKIAVNGRHFGEFRHRIPLASARFIHVNGQVKIFSIKVEGDPNSVGSIQMGPMTSMSSMTTMTPSAPTLPPMSTSMPPYQPPQPYQTYQHPPYSQYNQPNPYATMSSTVTAVPSSNQSTYPNAQTYPQQTYYYPPQQCLSSQPYQQYPSYHTYQTAQPYTQVAPKSSTGSTALKYVAGAAGIGLGAYALSQVFDGSGSDTD